MVSSTEQEVLPKQFKSPASEIAFSESIKALESISLKNIGEIKAFACPPDKIKTVICGVGGILENKNLEWVDAKKTVLGDKKMVERIKGLSEFDKLNPNQIKRLKKLAAQFTSV